MSSMSVRSPAVASRQARNRGPKPPFGHPMNRYFFHTEDGHCIADAEASPLHDFAAARGHVVQLLADLLDRQPEAFRRADRRVVVSDDSGLTLFKIELGGARARLAALKPSA